MLTRLDKGEAWLSATARLSSQEKVPKVFDGAWRPGPGVTGNMSSYYRECEERERKLAAAAHREWEKHFGLAENYRLLAEKAKLGQRGNDHPANELVSRASIWL